jgi:3-oxoacyl-(acyl-carrier-protein) synthase
MRVAITGLGVVAPGAIGVDRFRELLDSGQTAITVVERFDTIDLRAHNAALVRGDFKPRDFIAPMKMRRMNLLSRYGVSAAKLAIDDRAAALPNGTGVALGTSFGPVQTSVDYMQEYVEKGAALAPPQLFAESVANAPGSHIAIEHDLRGFNVTMTQREASALAAAMYAAAQIVKGVVPAALTGGVEEINEMVFSVLDRIGALAHASGAVDECARPFDRRRNGFSIGEGSAVFVVEASPSKEPYGYFAGFGIARDTTASISDWGDDPGAVVTAMRAALDDAEIAAADVDAVYASANASVRADRVEARALRALFGDRVPPVVATKGIFGEYAGAGSLQLAAALLAIRDQTLHKSAGFEDVDPQLGITATGNRQPATVNHVLVNSLSAGGGIVCAVLSREAA